MCQELPFLNVGTWGILVVPEMKLGFQSNLWCHEWPSSTPRKTLRKGVLQGRTLRKLSIPDGRLEWYHDCGLTRVEENGYRSYRRWRKIWILTDIFFWVFYFYRNKNRISVKNLDFLAETGIKFTSYCHLWIKLS